MYTRTMGNYILYCMHVLKGVLADESGRSTERVAICRENYLLVCCCEPYRVLVRNYRIERVQTD